MTTEPLHPHDPDERLLDEATAAINAENPTEAAAAAAVEAARVCLAGAADTAARCAFIPELDALAAGTLSAGRAALVEDHARECLACRRALRAHREPGAPSALPPAANVTARPLRFGLAAAAVLAAAAGLAGAWTLLRPSTPAGHLTLTAAQGNLLSATGEALVLANGARLAAGETVRTARGSRATFRLDDGTVVEMNERTELALLETRSGTTLRLGRGDVIVEAAHRRQRDLFVQTNECTVAVKGTVFTVGHGLKGSRVGVLEGEVHVDAGHGEVLVLGPGEQMATRAALTPEALARQVAWSERCETWKAVLAELRDVEARVAERVPARTPRHASRALDALPGDTVVFAALPNDGRLAAFAGLLRERLAASPALGDRVREQEAAARAAGEPSVLDLLDRLGRLSSAVGDEVVIAFAGVPGPGHPPSPILIAPVRDEAALRHLVESDLAAEVRQQGGRAPIILDSQHLASAATDAPLTLTFAEGHVIAGLHAAALESIVRGLATDTAGTFRGTAFHARLTEQYRQGAEFLVGVDLERIVAAADQAHAAAVPGSTTRPLAALGLDRASQLIVTAGAKNPGTAVLGFRDERHGLSSWLAEPAPLGVLDFVTPEASAVIAAVVKDPEAMLADLRVFVGETDFASALASFQEHTGLDLIHDVAAPLGGEVALALDGPLLPTPAWKLVLEVYDGAAVLRTIERLADRANDVAAKEALPASARMTLRRIQTADGPLLALSCGSAGEIFLGIREGYLVAAPRQDLVEQAFQAQRLGRSLSTSPRFTSLLPTDGERDVSLVAWQDLGPSLSGLGDALGAVVPGGALTQDDLLSLGLPSLLHARASERQVVFGLEGGSGPGTVLSAVARYALIQALSMDARDEAVAEPAVPDAESGADGAVEYDDHSAATAPNAPRSRARRF